MVSLLVSVITVLVFDGVVPVVSTDFNLMISPPRKERCMYLEHAGGYNPR